jgi:hypothetical protein
MIEVVDRVPTYPGRVKLTPVSGQANTYDMVRADEPIEVGTPINKALFDSMISEIEAMRAQVNNTLFAISQRALIGDVVVGTEIVLEENGIPVPFIKIQSNYESTTGSLVMRKHCVTKMPLANSGDTKYDGCRADLWLNNEYFSTLSATTQAVALRARVEVRETTYSGTSVSSSSTIILKKVFLLSANEQGLTSDNSYDGTEIAYFNSTDRRTATYNGVLTDCYTRGVSYRPLDGSIITTAGTVSEISNPAEYEAGIRPVLLLPNTYEVSVLAPGI